MTANRGVLALRMGDWAQARVDLESALALGRQIGAPSLIAYPLFELARLRLAEGADAEARRYLEESIALAEGSGDLQALRHAHAVLAERDLYAGRPAAAHARLAPLLDRPDSADPDCTEEDVTLLRPLLAQAELELGHMDAATRTLERVAARARATSNRLALLEALRVQALLATQQKRWSDARTLVDEALDLARSMPYPHAEAHLLYIDGVAQAQRRATRPALERFNEAQSIFRRLGAQRDVEQAAQAIIALQ